MGECRSIGLKCQKSTIVTFLQNVGNVQCNSNLLNGEGIGGRGQLRKREKPTGGRSQLPNKETRMTPMGPQMRTENRAVMSMSSPHDTYSGPFPSLCHTTPLTVSASPFPSHVRARCACDTNMLQKLLQQAWLASLRKVRMRDRR